MLIVTSRTTTHALVSLAQVKAELSISGDEQNADLLSAIDSASVMIAGRCNRIFAREGLRQIVYGIDGRECLLLARRPATVLAVTVDDVELAPEEWALPEDSARLMRLRDGLPCAWSGRVIIVEYAAGYRLPGQPDSVEGPPVPEDLRIACLRLVTALRESAGRDPMLRSASMDQVVSRSWVDPRKGGSDLPPQVADGIARYVRRSFA
ncbi:hypothetical protein BKE38_12110 [Pseudoroseomonas deserti]|uniref:Uncharacterized protein n=1 Tax=Teichococcus deserti TaxID=1817963 RepID=A0A1V2H226_9PROT|nr:hypothetical protein [Pseudoroseomonas deserti]ONG53452.1 hypothetical protein BKE38_12110 [Pseudoroseomonas deserti]